MRFLFFGDWILIASSATGFSLLVLASKKRVKRRNVVLQSDVAQCFSDDAAENGPCEARGWGNNSASCPTSFFAIYGLNEDGKPNTTSELDRFPSKKTIFFRWAGVLSGSLECILCWVASKNFSISYLYIQLLRMRQFKNVTLARSRLYRKK